MTFQFWQRSATGSGFKAKLLSSLVLFHALFLLPTPVAMVGCDSNWNLTVLISSVPLFATTYNPISVCALKHSFSDVHRP